MARQKRPAVRSPLGEGYMVVDSLVNPQDMRDAIPGKTLALPAWRMGRLPERDDPQGAYFSQYNEDEDDSASRGRKAGRKQHDKVRTNGNAETTAMEPLNEIQNTSTLTSVEIGQIEYFLHEAKKRRTTPGVAAHNGGVDSQDKENGDPISERNGRKRTASLMDVEESDHEADKSAENSSDSPETSSDSDDHGPEPQTMGEFVASLGVRTTRRGTYKK